MKLDKYLYENIPKDSISELIERKTVYDRFLKRDVPSIFDPV